MKGCLWRPGRDVLSVRYVQPSTLDLVTCQLSVNRKQDKSRLLMDRGAWYGPRM